MTLEEKMTILADAAKYDVSCASSGSERKNSTGMGSTAYSGICHSFSADGRCISLLKVLLSNVCIYDCLYCSNRRSNDIPRATFSPQELIRLTLEFYKRNYIEGLFLSSGIIHSPDHTMELLLRVLKSLRHEHHFQGYIHLKVIPGASDDLIREVTTLADRVSANIEVATPKALTLLAPEKKVSTIHDTFSLVQRHSHTIGRQRTPMSTQLIVGATQESDLDILSIADTHYHQKTLARVYYSAYIPIQEHTYLPSLTTKPPLLREHRLYQADWLLRFYGFTCKELLNTSTPNLNLAIDPKLDWALRHLDNFPINIDRASFETLIKIPGIGHKNAWKIIQARRYGNLNADKLKAMNISIKKSRFFMVAGGKYLGEKEPDKDKILMRLLGQKTQQLGLFDV